MNNIGEKIIDLKKSIDDKVCLVAVSKTKPMEDIQVAYNTGQRIFGENKVQELVDKNQNLPNDIEWHFIGHLQTNKAKFIVPFVSLIHAVDSVKLLKIINKEAKKINRKVDCLLQVHIASEESKFGFSYDELEDVLNKDMFAEFEFVNVVGLMAMATNTNDEALVKSEFDNLHKYFLNYKSENFKILSMGMSNDYKIAINSGSNMVRIGSTIFGSRNYMNK